MIQPRFIGFVLGQFLLGFGATMLIPLAYTGFGDGSGMLEMGASAGITVGSGAALLLLLRRPPRELNQREGLMLVCTLWAAVSFFGALPFWFSPQFPTFTDAFFESVSGFTTTGATILPDVEVLTTAVQLWRCGSHWLGGMGIVVLGIAILPLVGHGGMYLYRAEFSGAKSEKLKPRIEETALALWRVYFALSLAEFLMLRFAGMNTFEALCHTFSTLGTGGFSTRTASVAGFNSPLIEWIIIVFMVLAGMSFIQHFYLWIARKPLMVWRDIEVRSYLVIILAATAVIALVLLSTTNYGLERSIRTSAFQVASIITTTGFVTDNFEIWHPLPQLLLLTLMFVGGCTGSTSGGMKVSRVFLLTRVVDREFKRMVERRGVFAVRFSGDVIPESTVQSLLNLVYLAFFVNFAACILLAAMGVDVLTSISAVAASMFNVGPGLGDVGPLDNYSGLPWLAKWVLSFCMIAGRLEFYTVLVILTPWYWRR